MPFTSIKIFTKAIKDNDIFSNLTKWLLLSANILITMFDDDRDYVRVLALRRIIKTRETRNSLRTFKFPEVNFEAKDFINVTNWADVT